MTETKKQILSIAQTKWNEIAGKIRKTQERMDRLIREQQLWEGLIDQLTMEATEENKTE